MLSCCAEIFPFISADFPHSRWLYKTNLPLISYCIFPIRLIYYASQSRQKYSSTHIAVADKTP